MTSISSPPTSMPKVWLAGIDLAQEASDATDFQTQLILSVALGLSAFIAFCILRPRWATLYAARKRHSNETSSLPELPDTFLGWIPALYRISEREVLDSAGLDAYVFLNFFRMAIKFLIIACLAVLIIMTPVRMHFGTERPIRPKNGTHNDISLFGHSRRELPTDGEMVGTYPPGYFWMHVVFVYLFTALIFYLLNEETKKVVKTRQEYLGGQSTVTDRTICLSGIPTEMRSENRLHQYVEALEVGKVESVTICRDWTELDKLMNLRISTLRKLEEVWAVYIGYRQVERNLESLPITQPAPPEPLAADESDDEGSHLLGQHPNLQSTRPYAKNRPTTTVRFGFFKTKSKKVDAIDYYEEKLRDLDAKIKITRQKEFKPTSLAFVTLDSVAASQMAVQAILDPHPSQLVARPSPAPSDIVWKNTYQSRTKRMFRAWTITVFVGVLSVLWTALLFPISILLRVESIRKVLPGLGRALDEHKLLKSLVQTQLPTLVISLLNVAVPYLYDWLSNMQGMISQTDVELSVISKNFFFTFYNLFIFYTVLGSAGNLLSTLKDTIDSTSYIANQLAKNLETIGNFYINLIVLQGLGLFPFRLLEFGSLFLYPISLMGSKTPRDFAELMQPPEFKYGFYLPQTLLIFIICIVYSVLRSGLQILFFGLLYFVFGYFTYKYQLLYAMEHNQHSTGRAWSIIAYRTTLGVGVFHVAMACWLAFRKAIEPSVSVVPLIFTTIWFSYFYTHRYQRLTEFIALSSVRRSSRREHRPRAALEENVWRSDSENQSEGDDPVTVDEARERDLTFTNPGLISSLEEVWVTKKRTDDVVRGSNHYTQQEGDEEAV